MRNSGREERGKDLFSVKSRTSDRNRESQEFQGRTALEVQGAEGETWKEIAQSEGGNQEWCWAKEVRDVHCMSSRIMSR